MANALDTPPSRHLTRNEGLPTHRVRTTPERALRVRALVGEIVLCSLARFSRCLSPPRFINGYRRIYRRGWVRKIPLGHVH